MRWRRLRLCGGGLLRLAVWRGVLGRTIVVCRGGGWGWRRSRSRGRHVRRWYAAPNLVEETSVHSAIQSAMDCRDWHIGFDQFLILDLVGMFLQRRPSDFRIHDRRDIYRSDRTRARSMNAGVVAHRTHKGGHRLGLYARTDGACGCRGRTARPPQHARDEEWVYSPVCNLPYRYPAWSGRLLAHCTVPESGGRDRRKPPISASSFPAGPRCKTRRQARDSR
jgi:hypothetical protein